jgi:DNA primase
VSTPNGTTSNALIAHDMADIAWAVNMGCLGFDVWPKQPNEPSRVNPSRAKKDPLQ